MACPAKGLLVVIRQERRKAEHLKRAMLSQTRGGFPHLFDTMLETREIGHPILFYLTNAFSFHVKLCFNQRFFFSQSADGVHLPGHR